MPRVCLLIHMCNLLLTLPFFSFHLRNIARLCLSCYWKAYQYFCFFSHWLLQCTFCRGSPKTTLNKLQCVHEPISLILKCLYWLPFRFHVDFKMQYKALHGLTQYLSALFTLYTPKRHLRSSQAGLLSSYSHHKWLSVFCFLDSLLIPKVSALRHFSKAHAFFISSTYCSFGRLSGFIYFVFCKENFWSRYTWSTIDSAVYWELSLTCVERYETDMTWISQKVYWQLSCMSYADRCI